MDSVMLNLHSGVIVQFPASIASIKQQQLKVRTAVSSPKENVHFTSIIRPRNEHTETSPNGSKRSQSPRKVSASGRAKDDVSKISPSSDKKVSSVKQEELISLFRRIQSSISKAESVSDEKKETDPNQNKPAAQSVLEIIRRSRKRPKDNKQKPRRKRFLKKEEDVEHITSPATDIKLTRSPSNFVKKTPIPFPSAPRGKEEQWNEASPATAGSNDSTLRKIEEMKEEDVEHITSPVTNIKLTRPPSKFVKKSPIPFPSAPRGKEEQWNEASPAAAGSNDSTSRKIEEMKLQELKELAKTRGVRGYSRLKKKELVELLRS
ncbi:hypothetical protein NL676_012741 [Syzygium grande]|nr:hypothetical protein NL676_012741 [Syzygium grande]